MYDKCDQHRVSQICGFPREFANIRILLLYVKLVTLAKGDPNGHWQSMRVFTKGPGDIGLILDRVKPKTQKMVLDATLPNTHHCKVRIKGQVEKSRERSSALRYT